MGARDAAARELVAQASRAVAVGGLRDLVWGHVSLRDAEGRGLWIKQSGWGFEEITPERVHLLDAAGDVIVGEGPRHIEFHIHKSMYDAYPGVNAVVHAHSDAINAWCATGAPMSALTHAGILFTRPQLPRFTKTANLIRNEELGAALAASLGDAPAIVMPHHGFVTVGDDIPTAVMRAVLLERAASTLLTALAAGEGVHGEISAEDAAEMSWPPNQIQAGWGYLCRLAERTFLD